MGVFGYLSFAAGERAERPVGDSAVELASKIPSARPPTTDPNNLPTLMVATAITSQATDIKFVGSHNGAAQIKARRFAFRSFGFVRKNTPGSKPIISAKQEHGRRELTQEALTKRAQQYVQRSKSDKRAQESALAIRSLIVGPTSATEPKMTPAVAKPQLTKIKAQLMEPKSANQLIAQLRQLPTTDGPSTDHRAPIHAVCLEHNDTEEHRLHFSNLAPPQAQQGLSVQSVNLPGLMSAPVDSLVELFKEMHVINLITSPDFGLGQPGDGEGLLAGALPTAETVIEGVKQITPELMALGYATGKVITPDHSAIYPPTDRMSVLTYWWGLELLLPPPSLVYLGNAQSISGAVMNFLSALSLVNNGVREILPFIRYISQFIDFEFSAIKRQDRGEGVVCAATWIMPAAMVPRPWDFPQPPTPAKTETMAQLPDTTNPESVVSTPSHIYSVIDAVATEPPLEKHSVSPSLVEPLVML